MPNHPRQERKDHHGEDHPADAAHDIERKGEAGGGLELLVLAHRQRRSAVTDDQLPRLELADPARRLGVAGDEDQHAEQGDAEAAAGEGEGGNPGNRRDRLRHGEITAVLQQRPEVRVLEPMLHLPARLDEPVVRCRGTIYGASGRLGHPLLDDLVGERSVEFGQMVELGLVGRQALALRPQLGLQSARAPLRGSAPRSGPIPVQPSRGAMPSICPRRPATADVIRLVALDGQTTVSLCIGSSRCGCAAASASCIASRPASRNASSELSTL